MHDPVAQPPIYFGEPPAAGLAAHVVQVGRGEANDLIARLTKGECVSGMTIWSLWALLRGGRLPGGDGPTAPVFDLVCIDEASQMVLGHGLMALAGLGEYGRVVVAGDDQQLPPIRAGRPMVLDGRELGGSLYAFMKSAGVPEFALDETYRLNEPLTTFPERAFYPGRYVSRSNARLALRPDWEQGLGLLFRTALNPDLPLVVLLHDGPTAATVNPFEVHLASGIAENMAMRVADVTEASPDLWTTRLAIVSPHRAQNAAIRAALPQSIRDGAFVETVDRIQGKERDAVILSYCVADPEFALAEGEFIFSSERLNVASTRAAAKLIVVVSRRLLEAVPTDQELLDKAELLREFVFSCPKITETSEADPSGRQISVEIRARAFAGREGDVDLTPDPAPATPVLEMTPSAEGVLNAIRRIASEGDYGNGSLSRVKQRMALRAEPLREAVLLHRIGWISLGQRSGPHGLFWIATPFEAPRVVHAPEYDTVRVRIDTAIRDARDARKAFYNAVRDRFAWMDDTGRDVLMPIMRRLEDEGIVTFGTLGSHLTVAMRRAEIPEEDGDDRPADPLDSDFMVLNQLEDMEARRINFGVIDSWVSTVELGDATRLIPDAVAASLARLHGQGYVMLADEGRVRSRMAELARELRHVKQRFRSNDADRRPYLVRGLKIELRDRAKPGRALTIAEALGPAADIATPRQRQVLNGIGRMLARQWGKDAKLANCGIRFWPSAEAGPRRQTLALAIADRQDRRSAPTATSPEDRRRRA